MNNEDGVQCSFFLFVGDDPPRDRTSELRMLGFPTRHLGPVQMTTDTALGVTKLIVDDHLSLNEIPYIVSIILVLILLFLCATSPRQKSFLGSSYYQVQL